MIVSCIIYSTPSIIVPVQRRRSGCGNSRPRRGPTQVQTVLLCASKQPLGAHGLSAQHAVSNKRPPSIYGISVCAALALEKPTTYHTIYYIYVYCYTSAKTRSGHIPQILRNFGVYDVVRPVAVDIYVSIVKTFSRPAKHTAAAAAAVSWSGRSTGTQKLLICTEQNNILGFLLVSIPGCQ